MEEKHGEKLVRMANQIADFFTPYEEAEAVAGIHDHIRLFWTKGMCRDLLAFVAAGGTGLRPRVSMAVAQLQNSTAESPVGKAVPEPENPGRLAGNGG